MPLTERSFLNLKTVDSGAVVDLLFLKSLDGEDSWILAIPVRVNKKGIILALPSGSVSESLLEAGAEAGPEDLLGPSQEIQVVSESSAEVEVPVLLVEFSFQVYKSLEKKTSRTSKKKVQNFDADPSVLPSFQEVDQAAARWIASGTLRHEEFLTCAEEPSDVLGQLRMLLDQRLAPLEKSMEELRRRPMVPPTHKEDVLGGCPDGFGGDVDKSVLSRLRDVVGTRPQLADEPGRTGLNAQGRCREPALEEDLEDTTPQSDLDAMMKMAMLKLLKDVSDKPRKKSKAKRLPGLPWGDSDDSQDEEEEDRWTSSARSGKGIEQVEKLRAAMKAHPQAYIDRMESKMAKAVNLTEIDATTPGKYGLTVPIGKSKSVGYCLQGFLEIHKNMIEGKPKLARLNTLRMISAIEQFVLDENWVVAGRLTGNPEPPWGQWAVQDVPALRREYVYSRFAEPTWVGSLINELKEEDWLSKKRQSLKNPKGPGKGKEAAAGSTE